jgi:hypothetical protein
MEQRSFAPAIIGRFTQDAIRPDAELHSLFETGLASVFGAIDVTPRPIADIMGSLNIDVINAIHDDMMKSLGLGWATNLTTANVPTTRLVPARRSLPELSFLQALMYAVWAFAVWWMSLPYDLRRFYQGDVEVLTGLASLALALWVSDRDRRDD